MTAFERAHPEPWPADHEQMARANRAVDTEAGVGPFVLVTLAYAYRQGSVVPRRVTHRFMTAGDRTRFRTFIAPFGIIESEREEI